MRPFPLLLLALLVPAFSGAVAAEPPPGTQNPLVGQAFGSTDALRWMTKDGKPFRFEDQPYTLVRWWTNGCAHCAASLPALAGLERKYKLRGLRLVAVYHPKGRELRTERTIRKYLERLHASGDVAVDRRWVKLKELMARGRLTTATSVSFLVDANGIVRWVHPGPRLYATADPRWAHADRSLRELDGLLARRLDPTRRRILHLRKDRAWVCAPDGSGAVRLDLGYEPDDTPVWDPAGRRMAFSTGFQRKRQIGIATLDGPTRLFDPGVGAARVDALRWSPKGDSLLLVLAYLSAAETKVFLLDPKTGRALKTATGTRKDLAACWAPSGRALAIVTLTKEWQDVRSHGTTLHYESALEVLDLETGKRRRLVTPEKEVWDVAWSPDGKTLAYGTADGLSLIDADGGNRRELSGKNVSGQPVWSPDGKHLVVAYPMPMAWDLALFRRDGSLARHWRAAGFVHSYAWSPDGAQLAFVRRGRLLRVAAAGGDPVELATGLDDCGVSWR